MTIEGTEALLKSDIVILSKYFNKSFINFLTDNKKNFLLEKISQKRESNFTKKFFPSLKNITHSHTLSLEIPILIIKMI